MSKKNIRRQAIRIQNNDARGGGKIRPMAEAIKSAENKSDD